jgi:hypothetical protein
MPVHNQRSPDIPGFVLRGAGLMALRNRADALARVYWSLVPVLSRMS